MILVEPELEANQAGPTLYHIIYKNKQPWINAIHVSCATKEVKRTLCDITRKNN